MLNQPINYIPIIAALTLLSCNASQESRQAYVVQDSIISGDTFQVRYAKDHPLGNPVVQLKLCGIDVTTEAKPYIEELLRDIEIPLSVTHVSKGREGNVIAEVFIPKGDAEIFLNGELILQGFATQHDRHECPNQQALQVAENLRGD